MAKLNVLGKFCEKGMPMLAGAVDGAGTPDIEQVPAEMRANFYGRLLTAMENVGFGYNERLGVLAVGEGDVNAMESILIESARWGKEDNEISEKAAIFATAIGREHLAREFVDFFEGGERKWDRNMSRSDRLFMIWMHQFRNFSVDVGATEEDGWKMSIKFPCEMDPCERINFFNFLDRNPEIRNLITNLHALNFRDFKPAESRAISRMSRLRTLDLDSCDIGNIGAMQHISKLKGLENLNISYNPLKERDLPYLSQMQGLKKLLMSQTISPYAGFEIMPDGEQLAECVSKLNGLLELDISRNEMRSDGAGYISKISGLKKLNIYNNDMRSEGAKHLSRLKALEVLDISDNQLDPDAVESLATLHNLKDLIIGTNYLGDEGARMISSKFEGLERLDIETNRLSDSGVIAISGMQQLIHLDISRAALGEEGAFQISNMSNLKSLRIACISGGDLVAKYISKMEGLENLDISNAFLTDEGARYISQMQGLKTLNVLSNRFTSYGRNLILSMKKQLSELLIEHSIV